MESSLRRIYPNKIIIIKLITPHAVELAASVKDRSCTQYKTHFRHLLELTNYSVLDAASEKDVVRVCRGYPVVLTFLINTEFVREGDVDIPELKYGDATSRTIFHSYEDIRLAIKEMVVEEHLERDPELKEELKNVVQDLTIWLVTKQPDYEEYNINNISEFLWDIRKEMMYSYYVSVIGRLPRNSWEFKYINNLHLLLCKNKYYMASYERIVEWIKENNYEIS